MKSLIMLGVACLFLTACATTQSAQSTQTGNKKPTIDCQNPDWQALGVADGKVGRYAYEIARYHKKCPNLTLDISTRATWEAGYQEGLKSYCTKAFAYELGQRGYAMNQVCPEEGLLEIQQSHALGYQQYYQRARLHDGLMYGYPFGWFAPYRPFYW